MMDASLDTDVVIHLFASGRQELLFSSFDTLYMFDFIIERELKVKNDSVYDKVGKELESGRIKMITVADLIEMGIKSLFDDYKRDFSTLFDQGELHAIALAKAMGIAAFVSDDTKEQGPHQTLVQQLIEDVIPFAFYELLFLKFLRSIISVQAMKAEFEAVNDAAMSQHPMSFRTKMSTTVRRFSDKAGTERDREWMSEFCRTHGVNYRQKMQDLKVFLDKQ